MAQTLLRLQALRSETYMKLRIAGIAVHTVQWQNMHSVYLCAFTCA